MGLKWSFNDNQRWKSLCLTNWRQDKKFLSTKCSNYIIINYIDNFFWELENTNSVSFSLASLKITIFIGICWQLIPSWNAAYPAAAAAYPAAAAAYPAAAVDWTARAARCFAEDSVWFSAATKPQVRRAVHFSLDQALLYNSKNLKKLHYLVYIFACTKPRSDADYFFRNGILADVIILIRKNPERRFNAVLQSSPSLNWSSSCQQFNFSDCSIPLR